MRDSISGYIRLARLKHGLKNAVIFVPVVCSGQLFDKDAVIAACAAFFAFWAAACGVYAVNDVLDARCDRLHPVKRFRPVAAGDVSAAGAIVFALSSWILAAGMLYSACCPAACIFLVLGYIAMNVLYSAVLKSVPVLDVSIVVFGFVVRAAVGSAACGVSMSPWLYLSVLSASAYLALQKRLAELRAQDGGHTARRVLGFYSEGLLRDHIMSCRTMAVVFYALWSISPSMDSGRFVAYLPATVPFVMVGLFRYDQVSGLMQKDDVVEVICGDPFLLAIGSVFVALVCAVLYAR